MFAISICMARTVYMFVCFDYFEYDHLRTLGKDIPIGIRFLACAAPVASFASVIIALSFFYHVRTKAREHHHEGAEVERLFIRDLVMLAIIAPLMTGFLALKAEVRILEAMHLTGTMHLHSGEDKDARMEKLDLVEGCINSALCIGQVWLYVLVFQFINIFFRVQMRLAPDELKDYLDLVVCKCFIGNVEFFGLFMYIGLGLIQTCVNFLMEIFHHKYKNNTYASEVLAGVGRAKVGIDAICTFYAIIVFVTSQLMLRREQIREYMPNAGTAFKHSRWLLMAPLQYSILQVLIPDVLFRQLVHTSALCFECLVVVYTCSSTWKKSLDHAIRKEDTLNSNVREPLLDDA